MSKKKRRFKDASYVNFARIGKAFAAPKRLELLELLCQGPRTVEALANEAEVSIANASQHLRHLRAARLVESEKSGQYVEYRLASEEVAHVFVALRSLAEARLLEMNQIARDYLRERSSFEPVESNELLRHATSGDVVVLDVRPGSEYDAGHLVGALSIPVDELSKRLAEVPRGREIVAYCRGPYCVMALDAVEMLRNAGFCAHRLEFGVPDFLVRGAPVEGNARTPSSLTQGVLR
jgi:rhodanese-related sulfurtransferase/DNA-binding transcriptional ArsR family regulator